MNWIRLCTARNLLWCCYLAPSHHYPPLISFLSYTISRLSKSRGNNGKPNQCASGTSCGAQASPVAGREVGSGDFSHRVVKRFCNTSELEPTDPNHIGGVPRQNG